MRISDWSSDVCSSDLDVARGFAEGVLTAVKMYPARSTTNSAAGVTDIRRVYRVLERMQGVGMPLLLHGEVADQETDVFDREKAFIDRVLVRLRADFPALRIVLEHITTAEAVDRSEEHTSELQSLMRNSYAVFCLK